MSAKKVRIVTATGATITGREEFIVFNASGAISFNLGPSYGDGRSFDLKNIGAGAVTLVPYGSDVIWDDSSIVTKSLAQGESINITDSQAETWVSTYTDFETTPIDEGGTGITGTGVTKIYYVDGGRSDTYTEDGSILRPYKTILAAQNVINTATALLMSSEALYDTARFVVNIAPGIYSDNITINSASGQCKYLRYNLEGVTISGNISIHQNQAGVTDYYSKVEFFGGLGTRPEKGRCGRITGDITFLKSAYDSLSYDTFFGMSIEGDVKYGASAGTGFGTWVLYLQNSSLRTAAKSLTTNFAAGSHCVLIEAFNSEIRATLTGVIDLYTCNNSSFSNMTITPANGGSIRNCTFSNTVSIIAAKTLSMDACSYKSLMATTPTLTNITISHLDNIGADPSPCGARTAGAITATGTINANIDALDASIGFEAQMSGTPNLVTKTGTIFQMLDQLDTKKSSQTVKKTIGWDGAVGTDFVFAGDANHTAQNIDLGAIVPAKARVTGIEIVCTEAAVGVTDITFRAGNASAGEQFIASASCDDINEVVGIIDATKPAAVVMNWASATNIWIGADPSDNTWGDMTAGKWAVYVTFNYYNNI